jgi:hypothetical protein
LGSELIPWLTGHLLRKGGWDVLSLPALAEGECRIATGPGETYLRRAGELLDADREPLEVLEEYKRAVGSYVFSAQYQQQPVPPEGNLLKWNWFRTYSGMPVREPGDQVVQSWDTAVTAKEHSDYSVCTTWLYRWRTQQAFLLDVYRAKLEYQPSRRKSWHERRAIEPKPS